ITIIVVAVPEGLPMAVTMALAFATTQMLKDSNLVRVLAACETMGNATAICSDKTGTLTQNKMTITEGTLAQEEFESPEKSKEWSEKVDKKNVLSLIFEGIALNSTAFEGKDENGKEDFVGSKTECALLAFSKNLGSNYEDLRHDATVAKVYPFASKRKTMTTIVEVKENSAPSTSQSDYRIHVKGASEIVLESCKYYMDSKGESHKLNKEAQVKVNGIISSYADKALRTIALAYRDISKSEYKKYSDDEPPLEELTLIGIVGIMDPLRPGVVESVTAFREAGVFVRMITGDNLNTAKAIARNAGILTKGGVAITGPELRNMSVEEQRNIIPRLQALMWGRAVNDGVRKFLTFQLTVNIAAVVLSFISAIGSENAESILSAVQLLWVNLIMDTLAALALATEPPTQDLLYRKPISKYAHLINYRMAKMILGQAIFQIIVNLIVIYLGPRIFHLGDSEYDAEVLRTMVFNVFVFLQVFNEINCRRIDNTINVFKDMFDNWIFIAVQVAVVVGQYLIVTFGGIAFKTVPLSLNQWLITVLIGSLSIPVGTVIRLLPDCGCENKFNEEAKPLASYSRMHWESAIGDVRDELRVYSLLRRKRGSKSREINKRSNTQDSESTAFNAHNSNYGAIGHENHQKNRFADLVKNAKKFNQQNAHDNSDNDN
ncbi:hypothetical protein CU098_001564, partial [Rhizopus stolonifer]